MPSLVDALRVLGDFELIEDADREPFLAWAATTADVEQAVASCPHARWLGMVAELLDQRVVWWLFRQEVDDTVPERADAKRRLEAGERPPGILTAEQLEAFARDMRSGDAAKRRAALRALGDDYDRFSISDLGYASGLRAPDPMLDAAIETLRARLDAPRMVKALDALSLTEGRGARDERYRRDAERDKAELRALNDPHRTAGPMGSAAGRSIRHVSHSGRLRGR